MDACRDAVQWEGPDLGTEDGYALRTAVVVGHDYCGFGQFATLPVGTVVTATTSRGTFTGFLRGCPGLQAGEESDSCGAGQG
ncbi:hypothetical protein ACWGQ5_52055 [Streptomyces sp. NPDC055722]